VKELGKKLSVAVVSSSRGGVFSYTQRLVSSLQTYGLRIHLLLDKGSKLFSDRWKIYYCWNSEACYPFQIFKALCACKPDIVHVQHEFFLYGGLLSALLFPILLVLAKLSGGKVVVTLHGVIPMLEINKEFLALNDIRGPLWLLKIGLLFLTKVIVHLADVVIVHEGFFAEALRNDYNCRSGKIHVIPHGVDDVKEKLSADEAKRMLGLEGRKVILFFGYLAKYKGIETLIECFKLLADKHPDWILIIGGGEHPRLRDDASYRKYLSELRDSVLPIRRQVRFTGFIPDEDLAVYITAADVVVLPYNLAMSSSGPFAHAISYEKPVIASDLPPFREVLPLSALFKKGDYRGLSEKIGGILGDESFSREFSLYMRKVKEERSWRLVGLKTVELYCEALRRG